MLVFAVLSAPAAREDGKAPERRKYQCLLRAKLKNTAIISLREEQQQPQPQP